MMELLGTLPTASAARRSVAGVLGQYRRPHGSATPIIDAAGYISVRQVARLVCVRTEVTMSDPWDWAAGKSGRCGSLARRRPQVLQILEIRDAT